MCTENPLKKVKTQQTGLPQRAAVPTSSSPRRCGLKPSRSPLSFTGESKTNYTLNSHIWRQISLRSLTPRIRLQVLLAEKDLLQTLMAAEQSQGSTRERELVDGDGTGDQSATDWLISGGTTLLFFISHLLFICSRTCLPGEFLMKQTRSLKTAASCDAKLPKCALSSSPNEEQTRSVKALLSLPVPPSVPPSVLCNSKPFTPRLKQIPPQRHLKSPQQTNVLIITSTFHFSRLHRRVFSCFPSPAFSFPECALGRTNNRIT